MMTNVTKTNKGYLQRPVGVRQLHLHGEANYGSFNILLLPNNLSE